MSTYKKTDLMAAGMAIFAMFFGAGNIIFPLVLGQQLFDQTPYAIAGLLITAVLIPFCGLFAMFLYQGRIRPFFGKLGAWPGLIVASLIIALLGPLGSTPRCIALSYSTLNLAYPGVPPILFNAVACGCLFLMAYKKHQMLGWLGYILTPFLLGLLTLIVILGLWNAPSLEIPFPLVNSFFHFWTGLKEGYNTMDLLAAIFFAPVIIQATQSKIDHLQDSQQKFMFIFKASLIGAFLLSVIYIGFSLLSSLHAPSLQAIPAEELLGVIALKFLGSAGGIIVCLTVILACLTTAVALIAAFTSFVHQELLEGKGSETKILAISLYITFVVACFEFQGISRFLGPVLEICYPFLILLTGYHLIEQYIRAKMSIKEEML